jgi:hypothetical protein
MKNFLPALNAKKYYICLPQSCRFQRGIRSPPKNSNWGGGCSSTAACPATNIAGRDPATGELVRLFHPPHDQWSRQFEWRAD